MQLDVFCVTEKGYSGNHCYNRDFYPKTGLKRAKGLSVPALHKVFGIIGLWNIAQSNWDLYST